MVIEKRLDDILDSRSKVKIIRLFASKREDFLASGSDIARLVGLSPPAAHSSLKVLCDQDILKRDIIGRQHIYRLNIANRTVKDILKPAFQKETLVKEDIKEFLIQKLRERKISASIVSLILYGSLAQGKTHGGSDCDIAVVIKNAQEKKKIEDFFIEEISTEFSEYFGISLDPYIKTYKEFLGRLKRRLAPISTMMKSYIVLYGKDPIDYR